jgi:hypothetical protein
LGYRLGVYGSLISLLLAASGLLAHGVLVRKAVVMKNLLPGKNELVIFSVMALLCTAMVAISPKFDLGLAALSIPIFISAAVMGLRRNWRLAEIREQISTTRSLNADETV